MVNSAPTMDTSKYKATIEYRGQIVPATLYRRLGFLYRAQIPTRSGNYILAWIPRWKVIISDGHV